jgi:4-amino-4-deoxy-L-arabinose transferase-like glycosyltransferase
MKHKVESATLAAPATGISALGEAVAAPDCSPTNSEDALFKGQYSASPDTLTNLAQPRFAIPLMTLVGALLFLVNLGGFPLYTKGEPREAVTVFDIVHGGGVILPMRAGVELPSKPLMMHWLAALISLAAGRVSEWTVRLPSALCAVFGVLACYYYLRRLFDARSGLLGALILATTVQYLQAGRGARVDMALAFFLEVAFFEFVAITEGLSGRTTLLYVAIACAVLTKGPIGLALPLMVAACWLLLISQWGRGAVVRDSSFYSCPSSQPDEAAPAEANGWRATLRRLTPLRGVLIVGIVGGGWYLAALAEGGFAFVHKQLLAENLYRLFGHRGFNEGHRHAFYYMEGALAAGFMPWTPLAVLAAIQHGWRLCHTPVESGSSPLRRPAERSEGETGESGLLSASVPLRGSVSTTAGERVRRFAYLLVWFAAVLVFFNLPQSKRGVYLLPLYPALSGLVAVGLTREGRWLFIFQRCQRWFSHSTGVFFIGLSVCVIIGLRMLFVQPAPFERLLLLDGIRVPGFVSALRAGAREHCLATGLLPLVLLGLGVWLLFRRVEMDKTVMGLAAGMIAIMLAVNLVIEPAIADTLSVKQFAARARVLAAGETIGYFGSLDYAFAFYSGRNIHFVTAREHPFPVMMVGPEGQWGLMPPAIRDHYHAVLRSNPSELDGTGCLLLMQADK